MKEMLIGLLLYRILHTYDPNTLYYWVMLLICAAFSVFSLTGKWKILKKAGKTPWHCLVPVLGDHALYDVSWHGGYGILAGILYICALLLKLSSRPTFLFISQAKLLVFCYAVIYLLMIPMKIKLSLSFGFGSAMAFGLIVMEPVFYCVLGFSDAQYLGKTLRRYNPAKQEEEEDSIRHTGNADLISLYRSRSTIALSACVLTFFLCMYAVAGGLVEEPSALTPERGSQLFHLFTVNSNLLAAVAAALTMPFAVEGVRNKRFTYPNWIQLLQYSGAICTTLTFVFAVFLILPTRGLYFAFGEMNFWLHLICPIVNLFLLFSVETDVRITLDESFFSMMPFFMYAAVYLLNVVFLGEEHGGWRDIYMLATYMPPELTAPMMFLLGFGISQVLRSVYNRLAVARSRIMRRRWSEDITAPEIVAEVYDLGHYTGLHDEDTSITIPIDIFSELSERYGVELGELAKIFSTGVADGLKDRDAKLGKRRDELSRLFGTPEKADPGSKLSRPENS